MHSFICRERKTTWSWGTQSQHRAEEDNTQELVSVQERHYQMYTVNHGYWDIPPTWMPSLITARTLLVTDCNCIRLFTYKLFTVRMCIHICGYPYTHTHLIYTLLRMKEIDTIYHGILHWINISDKKWKLERAKPKTTRTKTRYDLK